MATFTRLNSGNWRVQIRRKSHVLSWTFLIKKDAEACGRRIEFDIDKGKVPTEKSALTVKTVADLIDLHIADMTQVGKKTGRSKQYSLDLIRDASAASGWIGWTGRNLSNSEKRVPDKARGPSP
jgi:hypothetical protein